MKQKDKENAITICISWSLGLGHAEGKVLEKWNAMEPERKTVRSRRCKFQLKIDRTNCLALLLYKCETFKETLTIVQSIQIYLIKCLRRIVKIIWPNTVCTEELRRLTDYERLEVGVD